MEHRRFNLTPHRPDGCSWDFPTDAGLLPISRAKLNNVIFGLQIMFNIALLIANQNSKPFANIRLCLPGACKLLTSIAVYFSFSFVRLRLGNGCRCRFGRRRSFSLFWTLVSECSVECGGTKTTDRPWGSKSGLESCCAGRIRVSTLLLSASTAGRCSCLADAPLSLMPLCCVLVATATLAVSSANQSETMLLTEALAPAVLTPNLN